MSFEFYNEGESFKIFILLKSTVLPLKHRTADADAPMFIYS